MLPCAILARVSNTDGVGGSNLRKKPRRGEAKSFEECRDAGLLGQDQGPGKPRYTIHRESGQGGRKSPAEAGLVVPLSIVSGLPSAVRTREATRQARFINEGGRDWFLCRVSDRNAARKPPRRRKRARLSSPRAGRRGEVPCEDGDDQLRKGSEALARPQLESI